MTPTQESAIYRAADLALEHGATAIVSGAQIGLDNTDIVVVSDICALEYAANGIEFDSRHTLRRPDGRVAYVLRAPAGQLTGGDGLLFSVQLQGEE